jgi:hypothetical protein
LLRHARALSVTDRRTEEPRPKTDLLLNGVERLSLVPVYKMTQGVEFRKVTTTILLLEALAQTVRRIEAVRFVTPPDEVVRKMLVSFFRERLEMGRDPRSRRWVDLEHPLTEEERGSLGLVRPVAQVLWSRSCSSSNAFES